MLRLFFKFWFPFYWKVGNNSSWSYSDMETWFSDQGRLTKNKSTKESIMEAEHNRVVTFVENNSLTFYKFVLRLKCWWLILASMCFIVLCCHQKWFSYSMFCLHSLLGVFIFFTCPFSITKIIEQHG